MDDRQSEPWTEDAPFPGSRLASEATPAESQRHRPALVEIAPVAEDVGDPLYCPFLSKISPHAAEAQRQTTRWAESFGLARRTDRGSRVRLEKYTDLVGHMFPEGRREHFQVVSDLTSWLFLHDDACD